MTRSLILRLGLQKPSTSETALADKAKAADLRNSGGCWRACSIGCTRRQPRDPRCRTMPISTAEGRMPK